MSHSFTRAEIQNTLLKNKVFDFLASHAEITWVDEVVDVAKDAKASV
jgi:hypothetical protein